MKTLFSLAKNTYREAIRDRILYTLFFFGFLFLLSAPLAGEIAAGQEERVVANFGLAMIHIFGIFLTVFIGSRLLFNEIDRKTIFLLIPKPIDRSTIVLSKFFGLGGVLLTTTALMSAVFFLLVPFSFPLLLTLFLIFLSLLLLLALTLFFSAFMSPLLSSLSSVLMFAIGNMTFSLKLFAEHSGGAFFQALANGLYWFLPNFSNLNLKNVVLSGIPYTAPEIWMILANAVLFIILFLVFAVQIFQRKEFS